MRMTATAETQTETITITVINTNRPPVLAPIGNQGIVEGSLLSFTVSATDADGDAITYSATNLPAGASINATTGAFTWTPSFTQAGVYPDVVFHANDGHRGGDTIPRRSPSR